MEVKGPEHTYVVQHPDDDRVGETAAYTLYRCVRVGDTTTQEYLLQVAKDRVGNGVLDRTAYVLRDLRDHAAVLETEYAAMQQGAPRIKRLNYDFGFPELVASFVGNPDSRLKVNVLAFPRVPLVSQMVPLRNITHKDGQRVDIQTSVWILGKTLKTLGFAHNKGMSIGRLKSSNILIEPQQHYVTIFDWGAAKGNGVPAEVARKELQSVARAVITLLGGNAHARYIPREDKDAEIYDAYTSFLFKLAGGSWSSAHRAHTEFYELVDSLWEVGFHPFTTFTLEEVL